MNRTILLLVLFIAVVCCSGVVGIIIYKSFTEKSKSEHQLSVEKIERMGKLELVRINIKDVLEQTKERPLFLPNAKAVLIVTGEAYAGIDLEKVKKEDIVESDKEVIITLPKPEILMSKINHEKSRVYNVKWGMFSTADLVDEAYRNAELAVQEEALKTGYEETCKNNARMLLLPIFRELSGKQIDIRFKS
jgi:hypothetical protein